MYNLFCSLLSVKLPCFLSKCPRGLYNISMMGYWKKKQHLYFPQDAVRKFHDTVGRN